MKPPIPNRQIIFVFNEVRLLKLQLQKICDRIRTIQNDTLVRNPSVFPVIVTEDKIGCKSNISWLDLDNDLMTEIDRIQDLSREENVCVADKIHDAVDSLPFTGNIIDVYIEQGVFNSLRSEHSYQLFGALRRLKDWHNAVITFVKTESCVESEEMQGIQRLLTASSLEEEDSRLREAADVIWRGKLSVIDKTINRGFILPGFTILRHDVSCRQLDYETLKNRVFGRMLELLDEVDISSIPVFYFTGLQLHLSLHDPHPQSRAMLELVSNMDSQCGYLCRLACYSEGIDIPSTAEKYLSTSSWKDSIINDITFVQEPEEDFLQPFEFTFFLLTKNPDKCSSLKFNLHMMKSASQINGFLSKHLLMRNILYPHKNTQELNDDPLENLPVFSSEVMSVISDILNNEQKKLFMQLDGDSPSFLEDVESVQIALTDIQGKILEEVKNGLPLYKGSCDEHSDLEMEISGGCPAELQMDPSEWPEKKYLLYQESQSKSISRLRSTDSLVLSSPIHPQEDTPPSMDIAQCLKLFQPDGSAVSQNLSPVRKRNTSRSRGKLSMHLTPFVVGLQWPDCLDQKAPDIYYNKDKKTEKTEEQCNKICHRYITNDTHSSCSSPVFVVSKKPKKLGKYVEDMLPKTLRRSPRKVVKGSARGVHTWGVRSSPRKLQDKVVECQKVIRQSPTKKVTKPCSREVASDTHRRQSLPSLEMKQLQQKDNIRRKSLTAMQAVDPEKGGRRESRSERHKRKLEEIVTDVVLKHGIQREDPIYKACIQKLFKVTKLFVMDLPNSQNLRTEMKSIAEGQVKQVVDLEKRKQKK
ncbi:mdm2-binding protein-like [Ostrea edulis]|uniref:mdm2-binding protein-like n=1 Tax=Ostrea edulis TaxID=37623 RepID=UPI0024AF7870|nr:mdm2-binding protein-like [Ostrea edulis]